MIEELVIEKCYALNRDAWTERAGYYSSAFNLTRLAVSLLTDQETLCARRNCFVFFHSSFEFSSSCTFLIRVSLHFLSRSQIPSMKQCCNTHGDDFSMPFASLELSFLLCVLVSVSS